MPSQLSFLYTTFSNEDDATRIARLLLEKHLIACMNLFGDMKALWFNQGNCEAAKEVAVLFKTTGEKIPALIEFLQEIHPYEIPVIVEIPIGRASESFVKWVQESTR